MDNVMSAERCMHSSLPKPVFDEEDAKNLSSLEIKKKYPRGYAFCEDCKSYVISYASYAHYVYGDW